jgi:hypothetical protein
LFEKVDRDQPANEVIDLPLACEPELPHFPFEAADGKPRIGSAIFLCCIEQYDQLVDKEPSRLDQKPCKERILVVNRQKAFNVIFAGL